MCARLSGMTGYSVASARECCDICAAASRSGKTCTIGHACGTRECDYRPFPGDGHGAAGLVASVRAHVDGANGVRGAAPAGGV
eukprot:gene25271-52946_t